MSDSFLQVRIVLAIIFGALLIIPVFLPTGRRERGFIYGAELALVFLAWFKIRNADVLLLGSVLWSPNEVHHFRTFLIILAAITTLFLLYQFIPTNRSVEESFDNESDSDSKPASAGR